MNHIDAVHLCQIGIQMRLHLCGAGLQFILHWGYSPSTGVVPVGVPWPSNVMAATFSSASFSLVSQRFFNWAPRSYRVIDASSATSPCSNCDTTRSNSAMACSNVISSIGVSVMMRPLSIFEHALWRNAPRLLDHSRLLIRIPPCLGKTHPQFRIDAV